MNYEATYNAIVEIRTSLQEQLLAEAAAVLQQESALRSAPDYRKIKVLSAAYVLEEFLANAIAASGNDDAEDAAFAELFDKIAAAEGKYYKALNEKLQNDPAYAVPEDIRQRNLELIRELSEAQK